MTEDHRVKIAKADVISFDIFDTLLARRVAHPKDVFLLQRELFNERSRYYLGGDFYAMRSHAESLAHSKSQNADTTLDDIYKELGTLYGYDKNYLSELKKYELLAETIALTRDNSVRELYDLALKEGKKIAIVSDMYLAKKDIEKLLKANGITTWDTLIVSGEDNVAKYNGTAFVALKKKYPTEKVLHIGDDQHSDFSWPRTFGFDSIWIKKNIVELEQEQKPEFRAVYGGDRFRRTVAKETISLADLQENIITGLIANRLVDHGTSNIEVAIGYGFFGPFLLSVIQWLHEEATKQSISHLFFLARDGMIMQKAYNLYYGDAAIPNTYTIGSRRVSSLPGIILSGAHDSTWTNYILGESSVNDIRTILKNFLINENDPIVVNALATARLDIDVPVQPRTEEHDRLRSALMMMWPLFAERVKQEQDTYLSYLHAIGLDSEDVAICDIGWNGTMQHSINTMLGNSVKGLYVGVSGSGLSKRIGTLMRGYIDMRDSEYEKDKLLHVFDTTAIFVFLEVLFTNPDEASYIGLKKGSKKDEFIGIQGDYDDDNEARERIKAAHHATLEFIKDYAALDLPKSVQVLNRETNIDNLLKSILEPSDVIAEFFGKMKYRNVAYSQRLNIAAPNHPASYYKTAAGLTQLKKEFHLSRWPEGFKKNCQAQGIPTDDLI